MRCFKQIEGFGTYGFPESHAARLCAACLYLGLDQMPLSGCVYLRAAQRAADGVLLTLAADRRGKGAAVFRCVLSMLVTRHGTARWRTDPQNRRGHHALRLGLRMVKGVAPR